ncbi:membrane protein [Clostridium polyendosporum]|uniref:Membrane protein n=1 Tax=Clostridium polyendosporum TaxID=69208 RepID=A0A919VG23_9CLOT|nr:DUF1294 domain-containing protein [Clostridium polyendosporum]GIM28141.1 membrane protein [Clostridium polyendosporum]
MQEYLYWYVALINSIGFSLMYIDKRRAIKKTWRISERQLFLAALLGGSIGSILGMYVFRHKTKHWYFVYGLPVLLIIQVILIILLKQY